MEVCSMLIFVDVVSCECWRPRQHWKRNDNFIWLLAGRQQQPQFTSIAKPSSLLPQNLLYCFANFAPSEPSEALKNSLQEKLRNDLLMNGMRRK
jgi:hypothetical protein